MAWAALELDDEDGEHPGDPADLIELADVQRIPRPSWWDHASCREHTEVEYFPERGGNTGEARAICSGCLVRVECLTAALARNEPFGIWAGTNVKEREAARREGVTAAELVDLMDGKRLPRLHKPHPIWERMYARAQRRPDATRPPT